ncbi:MAG: hypothetical protein ABI134_22980 [Byssovorax sp.]
MIKIDPLDLDAYRKLYQLRLEEKSYDEAWCVAAVLVFVHKADEEQMRFFEAHRPKGTPAVRGPLDDEQWLLNLFHEEENIHIGKIFEMITPAMLRAKIETLKAKDEMPIVDASFLQDPATSTMPLARTFGWAAQALGLPSPLFYVRSDVPGSIIALANEQPTSVAGKTLLTGFSTQDWLYVLGKHLAMYRGEHYIKTLYPTVPELTVLLFAGIKVVAPDAPSPPGNDEQIAASASKIRQHIQPAQLDGLQTVVKKLLAGGTKVDVKRWAQTVEVTSGRAGLLLCGDLESAKKMLAAERTQPDGLGPVALLKELLVFWVSPQHHALRQALGIAITTRD